MCSVVTLSLLSCTADPSFNQSTEETRIIEHAVGKTAVPQNPQRVVALDYGALESAIALDMLPIATILNGNLSEQPAYLRPHLEDMESLGLGNQANLEKIAQLNPDLIIGCQCYSGGVYEQLSQIAPTVLTEDVAQAWQENFLFYGKVFGKQQKAQDILKQLQQQLDNLDLPQAVQVSVARIFPSHVRLYLKDSFSGQILEMAGLNRPPSQDKRNYQQQIGKERWEMIDGDVLFIITVGDEAEKALTQLEKDPLWSQLEVVQRDGFAGSQREHRAYPVPGYWVGSGVLAAQEVMNDLEKHLPQSFN
ncbi:MAG: ABC transporter substrate-binding protein [Cyanobacteria bacterium]|jgi:iron complex transport system substrate-binding protein|nr:ABC transporter substrate-binding protein [Cyanobacteria bacterium GSL.Bin21]